MENEGERNYWAARQAWKDSGKDVEDFEMEQGVINSETREFNAERRGSRVRGAAK